VGWGVGWIIKDTQMRAWTYVWSPALQCHCSTKILTNTSSNRQPKSDQILVSDWWPVLSCSRQEFRHSRSVPRLVGPPSLTSILASQMLVGFHVLLAPQNAKRCSSLTGYYHRPGSTPLIGARQRGCVSVRKCRAPLGLD